MREAREALGISLEEVATAMNLLVDTVRSIEEDAFENLPAPFTRGYIRSYARLLRLDGDVLVRHYDEGPQPALEEGKLVVEVAKPAFSELPQRHPGWVFGGAVFGVALAGAAVLWWAWPEDTQATLGLGGIAVESREPVDPTAPAAPGTGGERERPAADPATRDATTRDVSGATTVPGENTAGGQPLATDALDASNGIPVAAADEAGAPASRFDETPVLDLEVLPPEVVVVETQGAPGGPDLLELTFTEDCWVEVFDHEGRIVHMDLNLAGRSLRLRGQAPLSVRLGNAGAAALAFNGEPVPLAPYTRANVANLVLGE